MSKIPKFRCFHKKGGEVKVGPLERKNQNERDMIEKYDWLTEIHPRPSALWIQKTITLFHRFDKDGNGYLSDNDIFVFVDAFKKYGCLTKERVSRMRDKIFTFWKLFNNGAKCVTLEDFVKSRLPLVQNHEFGLSVWETYLEDVATLMFYSLDANEDGSISLQEFVLFFKCIDVKECYARNIFAALDLNSDRKITKIEFVNAFNDFIFNEEDSPCKELFGPLIDFQIE